MTKRSGRLWLGGGFLAAVAVSTGVLLRNVPGSATLAERLADHVFHRRDELVVGFAEKPPLQPGDPVYTVEEQAFALQGRVVEVTPEAPFLVRAEIDPQLARRLREGVRLVAMNPPKDLGWVLRTLVPPDLRREVLDQLSKVWEARRGETLAALKPHLLALLGDVTNVLVRTLPGVLERHETERLALFATLRDEIFRQELEPALRTEVYTRLEQRLGAVAAKIGAEIWDAISVGDIVGVIWTATKGTVGASAKDEMAVRLRGLLEKKAVPVVKARAGELWSEAALAVTEALGQPMVKKALDQAAYRTLEHPTFQAFVGGVLDEWILRNPELALRFDEAVRSRGLRDPLEQLYKAAEPVLEKGLEEVLTRADRKGMDHQLVRVLRHVVLHKDERYLLVINGDGALLGESRPVFEGTVGEDP